MSRPFQSAALFAALTALVSSGCCLPQAIIQNPTISNIVYSRPLLSRVIGTPACGQCACSDSAFNESYSELPSDFGYVDGLEDVENSFDTWSPATGAPGCNCGGNAIESSNMPSVVLPGDTTAVQSQASRHEGSGFQVNTGAQPTPASESDKEISESTVPSTVLDVIEPPASLDKPDTPQANGLPVDFSPESL